LQKINGITPKQYNRAVEEQLKRFLHENGISPQARMTAEQMRTFIESDVHGASPDSTIGKYNQGVMEQRQRFLSNASGTACDLPSAKVDDSIKDLIKRGKQFRLDHPDRWKRALAKGKLINVARQGRRLLGSKAVKGISGVAGGAVLGSSQAVGALSDSEHFRRGVEYLEQDDAMLARQEFLGTSGDPLSSAYGDLIASGATPEMALDFQKLMEWLMSN
jgi:hypothetical protein